VTLTILLMTVLIFSSMSPCYRRTARNPFVFRLCRLDHSSHRSLIWTPCDDVLPLWWCYDRLLSYTQRTSSAPFDLRVALVARASDIPVSSVVDCEEGSVVYIFLIRLIDGCTIHLSTAAGDGFLLFLAVFIAVTVNGATFSLSFSRDMCVAISGAMPGSWRCWWSWKGPVVSVPSFETLRGDHVYLNYELHSEKALLFLLMWCDVSNWSPTLSSAIAVHEIYYALHVIIQRKW